MGFFGAFLSFLTRFFYSFNVFAGAGFSTLGAAEIKLS
jgi:hypothetical protein